MKKLTLEAALHHHLLTLAYLTMWQQQCIRCPSAANDDMEQDASRACMSFISCGRIEMSFWQMIHKFIASVCNHTPIHYMQYEDLGSELYVMWKEQDEL